MVSTGYAVQKWGMTLSGRGRRNSVKASRIVIGNDVFTEIRKTEDIKMFYSFLVTWIGMLLLDFIPTQLWYTVGYPEFLGINSAKQMYRIICQFFWFSTNVQWFLREINIYINLFYYFPFAFNRITRTIKVLDSFFCHSFKDWWEL